MLVTERRFGRGGEDSVIVIKKESVKDRAMGCKDELMGRESHPFCSNDKDHIGVLSGLIESKNGCTNNISLGDFDRFAKGRGRNTRRRGSRRRGWRRVRKKLWVMRSVRRSGEGEVGKVPTRLNFHPLVFGNSLVEKKGVGGKRGDDYARFLGFWERGRRMKGGVKRRTDRENKITNKTGIWDLHRIFNKDLGWIFAIFRFCDAEKLLGVDLYPHFFLNSSFLFL